MKDLETYTAFEGSKLLYKGELSDVVLKVKKHLGRSLHGDVVVFSDETGKTIDFNFQGTENEVLKRLGTFVGSTIDKDASGPGRPKLGVVSREVSLLPRHWEWLQTQPGGASATLRKLVEAAKKKSVAGPSIKDIQERTYRFLSVIAGNLPNYEEVLRALYRKDKKGFAVLMSSWPTDIKNHATQISKEVFED